MPVLSLENAIHRLQGRIEALESEIRVIKEHKEALEKVDKESMRWHFNKAWEAIRYLEREK